MGRPRKANRKSWPPNLYAKPDGRYYFRDPRNGKTLGLGRDKAKALSEARAANAKLADMAPSEAVQWLVGGPPQSLADWIPTYLDLWQKKREHQKRPLAKNTLLTHRPLLARIAAADFAWKNVADVTVADVAAFLDRTTNESGMSIAYQMRVRLKDVFRVAETRGKIKVGTNPVLSTEAPEEAEVMRRRLSLDEFLHIRTAAINTRPWLVNAMNLALLTGQRVDDVSRMTFADYKGGSLYVIQGKGQGAVRLALDGKIRLTKAGISIEDVVKACRSDVVSQFLVHHGRHTRGRAKTGGAVTANGISKMFREIRDELGITATLPRTPPTFHEIRSLAERLYEEEYGREFAQMVLGHKNIEMTAVYNDMRGDGWQVVKAR